MKNLNHSRTLVARQKKSLAPLCLALFCAGATAARADTILVTNPLDSGLGSLREAIANAADGDTIDATGLSRAVIELYAELLVDKSVTILGPGPGHLSVGYHFGAFNISRVFHIGPGKTVTIAGLTIQNGVSLDFGGGILNEGSALTLMNCTLSGNSAYDSGGGIYNFLGTLTVSNCTLSRNSGDDGHGGGIFNVLGTLTVSNCTLSGNSSRRGHGGGVWNDHGSVTLSSSTLSDNFAQGGNGGGIYNDGGTLTLSASTLSGNSAPDGNGGGIYNDGGMLTLSASTLSSNSALLQGGGIYNDGAGGSATVTISTSTFSGNSAGDGTSIYNDGGSGTATLTLSACTFSDDLADSYSIIFNYGSSGSGTLVIGDTILDAAGPNGGGTVENVGTAVSLGYNLASDAGGYVLTAPSDQIDKDPKLGPLQDNGGPTFTHALLCGSPAIDAGKRDAVPALALNTDQRGLPRPVDDPDIVNAPGGDGSDIGAFEGHAACNRPPVAVCKDVTVAAGAGCTANASIDNGSSDPDAGDTITLSQSPAGPYPLGTTTVRLTVTDNHGASSQCSAKVTVAENTPPAITCPANITVNSTLPAGAVVNYPAPVATDNCPGPITVSCTPASGSTFPVGTTPVICGATDGSGNHASCTFTVRINGAADQLNDLIALVKSFKFESGTETSLLAKLQAASKDLSKGNVAAACSDLKAFISLCTAQMGRKQITVAQGLQMIADATRIRALLGC